MVLPILPTTPFLLLSAFLFSKSSDRFHEYLIQTKLYQKYINEMVIERKTTKKKRNQSLFTVTLIFLIAVMITPVWIGKICLLMVMSIHHFIISTLVCVLINVLLWKLKLFVVDVKFIVIKKNIEVK